MFSFTIKTTPYYYIAVQYFSVICQAEPVGLTRLWGSVSSFLIWLSEHQSAPWETPRSSQLGKRIEQRDLGLRLVTAICEKYCSHNLSIMHCLWWLEVQASIKDHRRAGAIEVTSLEGWGKILDRQLADEGDMMILTWERILVYICIRV